MLKQSNIRIGGIKLSFDIIEKLLGMDEGSIRSIEVKGAERSVTIIHHDIHFPTQTIVPGAVVWMHGARLEYIPRIQQPDKETI